MVTPLHHRGRSIVIGGVAAFGNEFQGIGRTKVQINDRFSLLKINVHRKLTINNRKYTI